MDAGDHCRHERGSAGEEWVRSGVGAVVVGGAGDAVVGCDTGVYGSWVTCAFDNAASYCPGERTVKGIRGRDTNNSFHPCGYDCGEPNDHC